MAGISTFSTDQSRLPPTSLPFCINLYYDRLLVKPGCRHYSINPQGCTINLGHNLTIDFPLASLSAHHGFIAFHLMIICILYSILFLLVFSYLFLVSFLT